MPTRGHGELAVTGSVRTAAAMPNDAKRVVRAALATAGKGWVGVAGRRCGKSRCKNGGGLVLDGVHEKMTWPGWKGVVGGGVLSLLASLPQVGLPSRVEMGAPETGLPQAGWHRRLVVVGRGLRHRLWRRVQRVRKVWRVWQRTLRLGSPPVRHEPAGNGHCHGDQREQRGDH